MRKKRGEDFSLLGAVRAPGFTPAASDADELVAMLAAEDDAALGKAVTTALVRVPGPAAAAALAALSDAVRPARGRLARLVARLAEATQDPELAQALIALAGDQDPKTVGAALDGLAAYPGVESEAALLALAPRLRREHRRALVRTLGKVGGAAAAAFLGALANDGDEELERLRRQAELIIARRGARAGDGLGAGERGLVVDLPPPVPVALELRCRPGLEALLAEELAEAQPRGLDPRGRVTAGAVTTTLSGPLEGAFALRLWDALALPLARLGGARPTQEEVVRALSAPSTRALLQRLTRGAVRYRIDWPDLSDARLWALVDALSRQIPELVNDPTESPWELGVDAARRVIELRPKRLADPRFAYRRGFVFAASHPTIAAALARLGGVEPDDVVWDPFAGSGLELIERARRGPYRALYGTDIDPAATLAARANLEAAGIERAELLTQSCLEFTAARPTLVLSNPPLGKRVHRGAAEELLGRWLAHAGRQLAPGGRIVMTSPAPAATRAAAEAAGLALADERPLDMGGFTVAIQRFRKKR
jgi:23S rRNA G2445 N2-methylase RlmL